MTSKTILSTILISLTAVSMIACDNQNKKNKTGSTTHITSGESLESQITTFTNKLEAQKEEKTQIMEDKDIADLRLKKAERDYNKVIKEAANDQNFTDHLGRITVTKDELDDAQIDAKELTKELGAVNSKIYVLDKSIDLVNAKIDIKVLSNSVKSLPHGPDKADIEARITTKQNLIESIKEDLNQPGQ